MLLRRHNIPLGTINEGAPEKVSSIVEVVNENATKNEYTKTEINRMPLADLKKLARNEKLNDDMSGADLKKLLIEHFNL